MREGAGVGQSAVSSSGPHPSELERPLLRILDLDQQMWVERLSPRSRARRIRAELDMSVIVFYHHRWTAYSTAYCFVERPRIMHRLLEERARITVDRRRLVEAVRRV
jgi:hypothetical protein